jgi:hypothetical protein
MKVNCTYELCGLPGIELPAAFSLVQRFQNPYFALDLEG